MYGTQTEQYGKEYTDEFENDVEMYGTQTEAICVSRYIRLRMM